MQRSACESFPAWTRLVWLVLAVSLGCGPRPWTQVPGRGGLPWHEVRTEHFRIHAQLDEDDARAAAENLERFRSALLIPFGGKYNPPTRHTVVILSQRDAFKEFSRQDFGGLFMRRGGEKLILLTSTARLAPFRPGETSTTAHELAHELSQHVLPGMPAWTSEGFATYLATAMLEEDDTVAVLGRADRSAARLLKEDGQRTLEEMWAWEYDERNWQVARSYYASAWAWMHYLLKEHPERFARYLQALARREEPRRAFEAAFAGVSTQQLEYGLDAYIDLQRFAYTRTPVAHAAARPTVRPMQDADVHAVRAQLFTWMAWTDEERARNTSLARQELDSALRLAPTHVQATALWMELSELPQAERIARVQALARAAPDDARAWALLAKELLDSERSTLPDIEHALQNAVRLDPGDARSFARLAWVRLRQSRNAEALPPASRALQLSPADLFVLEVATRVGVANGRCEEAQALGRRFLNGNTGHQSADPGAAARSRERLEEWMGRCVARRSATDAAPVAAQRPDAGAPPPTGSLDKELIRQTVRRNQEDVRACYERVLQQRPEVSGKVTIRWLISADGTVTESEVAGSTVNDAELETCVAEKVLGWVFPQPKGGGVVHVSYPFVFGKVGSADAGVPAPAP